MLMLFPRIKVLIVKLGILYQTPRSLPAVFVISPGSTLKAHPVFRTELTAVMFLNARDIFFCS